MTSVQKVPFSTAEAVLLCTAFVSALSRSGGIRALVVKGPLATQSEIRPAEPSSDVDVLVDPAQYGELLAMLSAHGWQERFNFPGHPRIVENHSVSLIHPEWPCDIDVHHTWPGFLVEPALAFDRLWDDREVHVLCHQSVEVPGILHHSIIMALHALREPDSPRGKSQYPFVRDNISRHMRESEYGSFFAREVLSLGAGFPLAPLLRDLGREDLLPLETSQEMSLWQIRQSQQVSLTWVFALTEARWSQRPRVLWNAMFPDRTALLYKYPELSARPWGMAHAWLRRLVTALPRISSSVVIIRRSRATMRDRG